MRNITVKVTVTLVELDRSYSVAAAYKLLGEVSAPTIVVFNAVDGISGGHTCFAATNRDWLAEALDSVMEETRSREGHRTFYALRSSARDISRVLQTMLFL